MLHTCNIAPAALQPFYVVHRIERQCRSGRYRGTYRVHHWIEPLSGEAATIPLTRAATAVQRLLLPYAVIRDGGRDTLVNREYAVLFTRDADGILRRGGTLPDGTLAFLYHDGTRQADREAIGRDVLAMWGVDLPADLADLVIEGGV